MNRLLRPASAASNPTRRSRVSAALALSFFLAACSSESPSGDPTGTNSTGSGGGGGRPSGDCSKELSPGDNDQEAVQTALIEVEEGGVVCLKKGTYKFQSELSLSQRGVTVRGEGQRETILDFGGQTSGANGVNITGDDVTFEDLQVLDTQGDGVRGSDVRNITFRNTTIAWTKQASLDNGAYGLYPVGCDGVRIEGCVVYGARDAGIYVGQSRNILVTDSEVYGNVAGIEIENSTDAEVTRNHAHDNVAGILVFNLPNLPVQDGKRAKIHDNIIESNNQEQFAEPGTVVANVPSGLGIIVVSSDDNEFHDNTIRNNNSGGFAIVSYLALLFGPYDDPAFDPFPEGNFIHDNTFEGNGTNPDSAIETVTSGMDPAPDLLWDGCVDAEKNMPAKNCFQGNGDATYYAINSVCAAGDPPSTDISEVTCAYDSLPPQDP
jgi:parallel beta-helix repeat protein